VDTLKNYKLTAVIWKEKEGYVSKCPELGVASCGDSTEEALKNLKEAVELYLENAKELGMLDEVEETLTASGRLTTSFEVAL
jgi:predicted RNase H-like HicB family nuclease